MFRKQGFNRKKRNMFNSAVDPFFIFEQVYQTKTTCPETFTQYSTTAYQHTCCISTLRKCVLAVRELWPGRYFCLECDCVLAGMLGCTSLYSLSSGISNSDIGLLEKRPEEGDGESGVAVGRGVCPSGSGFPLIPSLKWVPHSQYASLLTRN